MPGKKVRINTLLKMKQDGNRIVAITAYDYPTARIVERAGVDLVLIGDSLANVVLGCETTISATMDAMCHHATAVAHAVKRPLVVVDMPFMSYKVSVEQALTNAGRLMQEAGVEAVKVEGGREIAPQVEAMVKAGIPVLGHLGLVPQSVHALSGYRIQGLKRDAGSAERLKEDAQLLEELGCFGIVLELVTAPLAKEISEGLQIPTIGIGSGAGCDGQIAVLHDIIGLTEETTYKKFLKQYARVFDVAQDAVSQYTDEVRRGKYPGKEHSF